MVELWLAKAAAEVLIIGAVFAALMVLGLILCQRDRRKAD
jgi:hypothetical protein